MERALQQQPFGRPSEVATVVLRTRQLQHARLGLPLAAAACWILVAATVRFLNLERTAALGIIAGSGVFMIAAIAFSEWRARRQGLWARSGNPSLEAPGDHPWMDPKTLSRLQVGWCLVLAALVVGAFLYGVTIETAVYWTMAYGFVHMAIYGMLLCVNLEMREHAISLAWFVGGGMWWLATGDAVAFIFGGGWLLMGILLHARLLQFENVAYSSLADGGSQEDAP